MNVATATPSLSGLFRLNDDVLLIPVEDLPDESRSQLECETGDVAVSRVGSRGGSKIVDAGAADLLGRFREPRSIVEAAILFGMTRRVEPAEVLDDAVPLLRGMSRGRAGGRGGAAVPGPG
jgi:hypothetical protein